MPDGGGARPVTTRGGAGGIEAHYDDMVFLARLFGRAATELAELGFALHRYLVDAGLVTGGLVDPAGAWHVEADLAVALDGPGGLTFVAARCGAADVKLRAAAAAYAAEDAALSRVRPLVDGIDGLGGALTAGTSTLLRTGDIAAAAQRFVTADPALTDDVLTLAGGVDGPVAHDLTAVIADGPPVVRRLGRDGSAEANTPPRSLRDVMSALAARDETKSGEIDVRLLTRPDGSRAAVVDIPGTKSWTPLPTDDITSLATNLRAVRGDATGYATGVLRAMTQAGVRPTDDVMLVGHSEGGMVALRAAIDAKASGRFHVTHVVTAGSPIGAFAARVPSDVEVLALENKHDFIPHLDGRINPDRHNVTTVTFDRDRHSIGANHDVHGSYLAGAADADASADPSVRAFLKSAGAFLDADSVRTECFVIKRGR